MAATLVMVQLAGAAPAAAATGLVQTHASSAFDSQSVKSARADCPAGKEVISGNAVVFASPNRNEVRLIEMRPVHSNNPPDGYFAKAQEANAAYTGDWVLQVDAVCADRIAGLYLAGGSGPVGSTTVQSTDARCGPGEAVLGGGGLVRNPGFQADLRTVAPSLTGDRFTAQGGEDVDGYANPWSVVAYAICAPRPANYQVVVQPVGGPLNLDRKTQTAFCPAGTTPYGAGGSIDPAAPGGVGLEFVFVQPTGLQGTQALAVRTDDVVFDWGVFRVFAICAT
jgi:hypothetical protein